MNKSKTADGAEEGKGVRESSRTTEEGVREGSNGFTVNWCITPTVLTNSND